nr:TonB-dependent receptor [Sandarakinorhabdus sp.]
MLAVPGVAFAQAATTAAADVADDEGTIVVTGSLIKNPNLISAQPVTVTTADTIALRGSNVAEEVLRDIPGNVPSIGSAVNNGNGGASFVDLRGIGTNRNLVLLDGVRIAPAGLGGAVDLNNIPLALVERVDSLTGGAVTTYGADAISGVVNFVIKQNFTGVDLQLSNGLTERGDGNRFRADLTVGGSFDDGKGNAVLSVGYQKWDPVYQGARPFSVFGVDSYTGGPGGSGTAIPGRFTNTRGLQADGQISRTPAFSIVGFTEGEGGGRPILAPNPAGQNNPGFRQVNAAGAGVPQFSTFNFNPYNIFQTPFERFNIYGQANYQVSDAIEFYTRGMFSRNTVSTIIAPSGVFSSEVTIPLSNPFLPAALRNQFCARNVAPVTSGVNAAGQPLAGQATYTPFLTPEQCAAAAVATSPSDPNYRTVNSTLGRRTTEYGPRISEYVTTYFDYRAGVRGAITSAINWDLAGSYGVSENVQTLQNYTLTSRVRQSLLATNTTSCLPGTSAGCVPTNWFGPAGSISEASKAFNTGESTSRIRTTLAQVRGLVSGDLGIASPGATDTINFALGAEYRAYTATQRSDLLAQTAGELGGAGGANPNITGGYNVKEVYGELVVPLLQDKPLVEDLTLSGGARYSSYNVNAPSNPSYSTFTWKVDGSWTVVQGVKFRANYSRAVRAPNINELFSPLNTGLTSLGLDPCAGAAPVANSNLRAVCIAQGASPGQIGSIENPTAAQANLTSGGNLNLRPEIANTWSIGTVLQPSFIPGLALTVDYYNITINGAVSSKLPGDVVTDCFGTAPGYALANVNNPACAFLGRNPATGGLDGDPSTTRGLITQLSNLGRIATSGIDATASYSTDLGFAKLGVIANANYTISQKFQATPTSLNRECVGFYSTNCSFTGSLQPKFQSSLRTTFGFDSFDISGVWRHVSGFQQEPTDAAENGAYLPAYAKIGSFDYFDLTGRFNIMSNLTILLTVSNLFDKQPPVVGASAGSVAFNSGNTYPSTYDPLGRRYNMQVNVRF